MFVLLKSAALAALVVASAPVVAATLTLTSAGIYAPGTVNVTAASSSSSDGNGTADYSALVRFTASSGGFVSDFVGFCVDLFHPISVGIDGQTPLSLAYHTAPLLDDRNGAALSATQRQQIGGLAALGFGIAASSDADRASRLAAVQQAIWTIEYPTLTFTATGPFATQQGYADTYVAQAPMLTGGATAIYADDGATQGFVVSGVPEPTTWALLLTGFAFAGLGLRRRDGARRVTA